MNDGYGWTVTNTRETETYTYTNKFDSIPTTTTREKRNYGCDKFMCGPTPDDWKKPAINTKTTTKKKVVRKKTVKQIENEKKAKAKGITVDEYKRIEAKVKRYIKEIEEAEKRMAYIKKYVEEHKDYI